MEQKHLVGLAAVGAVGVMVYMMRKNATTAANGAVVPISSIVTTPAPSAPYVHTDGPNFAPIPQPVTIKAPASNAVSLKAGASGWGGVQNTPAPKPTAAPAPAAAGSVSTFVGVQGQGTAAPRPAPAPAASSRAGKVAEGWARINAQTPPPAPKPGSIASTWGGVQSAPPPTVNRTDYQPFQDFA